jgi:hypothetical protein
LLSILPLPAAPPHLATGIGARVIEDLAPIQSALEERFETVSVEWDDHRRKIEILVNGQRKFSIDTLKVEDASEVVALVTHAMGEWDGAG